jgi:maltose-binding protein MalE
MIRCRIHFPEKSYLSLLLTLLLVMVLATACNRDTPTPEPTPTVAQPAAANANESDAVAQATATPTAAPTPVLPIEGRIVFWHSWAGADGDALAALLLALKEQHPNLQVDTLFVAYNDLPQSYAEAVQAGGGPDLVLTANWWLGDMVAAQVAQPLDTMIPAAALSDYWPAALDSLRWDGKLYGLPINFELISLFYNRSLVAPAQVPTTMAGLLALAQANPQQGIGLYASLYHLYWGFPAYGAQLFNETGQVVLDQGNGAADYLTWLATVNQTNGSYVDEDYAMLLDRFKKGEFAFLVDGPWSLADLQGALGDNLAVAQLPAGPAGPAQPWLSADGLFINPSASADQQRLALAVAQAFTSAESGQILVERARRLSANRLVQVDDPLLQGFMQQAGSAHAFPMIPEMKDVWGYGGDLLLRVLAGDEEPTKVVAEATTLINEANGK